MSVIAKLHFLFGLDIRKLDYLGPFFGVIGDAFSEFGRRHRQRLDAQADKARLHSGIEHNGVSLLSFSMIADGVPLGAPMPFQPVAS